MLDFNSAPRQPGEGGSGGPGGPGKEPPDVAFMRAMAEHGLNPGSIIPGGLERFEVEKRGDKSGWYIFFDDGNCPAGSFGDWQTGLKQTWSYKLESEMSAQEVDIFRRHIKEMKEKRRTEEEKRHAEAKKKAEKIWNESEPAPDDHPYLIKKNVPSYGLKVSSKGHLIVPICDNMGDIHSLQFISPEGRKKFLPGGAISGNFFVIPGLHKNKNIYICEGYATGADIYTGTSGTVVCVFNAGNMKAAAKNVKDKFYSSPIFICADNDTETKTADGQKNPGVTCANEAATTINAKVIVPRFANPEGKATSDFNDLKRVEGLDAVKLQILGAPKRFCFDDWCVENYKGPAPERKWLVHATFPMGAASILAAMGDAGKGMLLLHLALNVAAEPIQGLEFGAGKNIDGRDHSFGNSVLENGAAVIFSAEDDRDEIHRRLEQIDSEGRRFSHLTKKRLFIIPLPNAGGPVPLVVPGRNGPEPSPLFHEIREQLLDIEDLKLIVFDPLASFVAADINADPAVGAFTTGLFSQMASETMAALIMAHHMGKTGIDKAIKSPAQARHMIRGTTAIVDGVRAAYVLWPESERDAKAYCQSLDLSYEPNKVFCGALVKSNGPGDREIKVFIRQENGLLIPMNEEIKKANIGEEELKNLLIIEIQSAAEDLQPFSKSGKINGVFYRKNEFKSPALKDISRKRIEKWVDELIEENEIVLATNKGSTQKIWLDVKAGPFAEGRESYRRGARFE